jgi:hypothetical protein
MAAGNQTAPRSAVCFKFSIGRLVLSLPPIPFAILKVVLAKKRESS